MGTARKGFNLLHAGNLANVKSKWRKGWHIPWRLVFEDTVYPLVCRVIGHNEYDCSDPGHAGEEFACRRCHQFTQHNYQPRPDDGAKYPQQGTM